MVRLKDIIIGTIIGILLNLFIHSFINSLEWDISYDDKYRRKITIAVTAGLISLILGYFMFPDNKCLKIGLFVGGGLLIYYSLIMNWNVIDNMSKTLVLGGLLGLILWKFS